MFQSTIIKATDDDCPLPQLALSLHHTSNRLYCSKPASGSPGRLIETQVAGISPRLLIGRFGTSGAENLQGLTGSQVMLVLLIWDLTWRLWPLPAGLMQCTAGQLSQLSSVQSLSHVQIFATPWTTAHQASLSITNSWSLLKLMSIELVIPSNHLILCCFLLLPSIFPSIRVFSVSQFFTSGGKVWSFSFSISPSNEYSGLISFSIDLFDLFAVQGTLKSLLQHHSSKASILWHSVFFIVQLTARET